MTRLVKGDPPLSGKIRSISRLGALWFALKARKMELSFSLGITIFFERIKTCFLCHIINPESAKFNVVIIINNNYLFIYLFIYLFPTPYKTSIKKRKRMFGSAGRTSVTEWSWLDIGPVHIFYFILLLAVWALSWLHNAIQQCVTVHPVPKFRSCHKAIMVITGRAHCIHIYIWDYIYLKWNIITLQDDFPLWAMFVYHKIN